MTPANVEPDKGKVKARLWEQLRDPNRFRMCVMGTVLLASYCLVYLPLSERIQDTTKKIDDAKKTLSLVRDIEGLRAQFRRVEKRLPKRTDSKEWAAYVLDGLRQFPLRLLRLDCDAPCNVGPWRAVVLRIDLEGDFFEADGFLRWLEADKRLFRVDSLRISPGRNLEQGLMMQFTILGLMG